jgi:hypothetical protein
MSDVLLFLRSLVEEAVAEQRAQKLVRHGGGFAVGNEGQVWVTLIPPVRVRLKPDRVFFDAPSGSARLIYRQQDGNCRIYLNLYPNGSDRPAFEYILTKPASFTTWLLSMVGDLAQQGAEGERNDRNYIRLSAARSFLGLPGGFGGGQINASFEAADQVIRRYPPSEKKLGGLARRAKETLFAELKQKAGFNPAALYEDPMDMPSPWHAAQILGVLEAASSGEVVKAYHAMARATHPDRGGNRYLFMLAARARDVMLKGKG